MWACVCSQLSYIQSIVLISILWFMQLSRRINVLQHCRSSLLAGMAMLLGTLQAGAKNPEVLWAAKNAIGSADKLGFCSVWLTLNESLLLDGGFKLPLRIEHNSMQRKTGSSCLGHGWWFPLLESTVTETNEVTSALHSPGGETLYFYRDPQDPSKYQTRDVGYTGTIRPGDVFEVETPERWTLRFVKGRLRNMKMAGGDELTWEYQRNLLSRITSRKLGELLVADYEGDSLKQLRCNQGRDTLTFVQGDFPLTASLAGRSTVANVTKSLVACRSAQLQEFGLRYEVTNDVSHLNMFVDRGAAKAGPGTELYQWRTADGVISQDPEGSYRVENANPALPGHAINIVRTSGNGKKEGYSFDASRGLWKKLLADGSERSTYFVMTPGPTFGHARKIERRVAPGDAKSEVQNLYSARFDLSGRVVREVRDDMEIEYRYDSKEAGSKLSAPSERIEKRHDGSVHHLTYANGELASSVVTDKNGGVLKKWYDANGDILRQVDPDGFERLIEYQAPGLPKKISDSNRSITEIRYDKNNIAIERVINGIVRWRRIVDAATELPWGVEFAENGQVHAVLNPATGEVLPQAEAAKILVTALKLTGRP